MRRYLLFSYSTYYPSGGMNDFQGHFSSVEEALAANKAIGDNHFHVFDTVTGTCVVGDDTPRESDLEAAWNAESPLG